MGVLLLHHLVETKSLNMKVYACSAKKRHLKYTWYEHCVCVCVSFIFFTFCMSSSSCSSSSLVILYCCSSTRPKYSMARMESLSFSVRTMSWNDERPTAQILLDKHVSSSSRVKPDSPLTLLLFGRNNRTIDFYSNRNNSTCPVLSHPWGNQTTIWCFESQSRHILPLIQLMPALVMPMRS